MPGVPWARWSPSQPWSAAGITHGNLAVCLGAETGTAQLHSEADFDLVFAMHLKAPVYWALDLVARIAEDRRRQNRKRWEPAEPIQRTVIFIGSVSSQGNKGQFVCATTKRGLEGAASTLHAEAMYYGVRCGVIHPGSTDTPMVRALGQEYIDGKILPCTQLRRLISPQRLPTRSAL